MYSRRAFTAHPESASRRRRCGQLSQQHWKNGDWPQWDPRQPLRPARLARLGAQPLVEANGDVLKKMDELSSPAQSPLARYRWSCASRTKIGGTWPLAENTGGPSTARAASSRTARQRGRTLRQYVQGREQQFDQVAKHEVKRVGLMLEELSCERSRADPSTPSFWQTSCGDWTSGECPRRDRQVCNWT